MRQSIRSLYNSNILDANLLKKMHFFPIVSSDHALQDLCNAQCSAVSNDCSCDEGRGVVPGITVGHEMVGVVEEIGSAVTAVKPGDRVLEVAGANDTFRLAWECARPNAIVTVVALYDQPQVIPLPDMYGKNLTFKTGGVDGCDCEEVLRLIEQGKIDTTPLITHRFSLSEIEEAYKVFEGRLEGVIKVAVTLD